MAKDKIQEETYKAEGKRRIKVRKAERLSKWKEKVRRYGRGSNTCSMCGGHQTWCSTCEVWSSTCCCDYGTCLCS